LCCIDFICVLQVCEVGGQDAACVHVCGGNEGGGSGPADEIQVHLKMMVVAMVVAVVLAV
jgi:hypothetical protein